MQSISQRADELYRRAEEEVGEALDALRAKHAAEGLLQSGATIKRAVAIFREIALTTTDHALEQIDRRIEHRGRKWRSMVNDVEAAAERYFTCHHPELEKTLLLASRTGTHDAAALINNVHRDMMEKISAYREGWTAPRHKQWIERHPVQYAVALLIAGALVGEGIKAIIETANL